MVDVIAPGGGGGAEVNDLSAAVTWANVPDANITEGSVTQHEAALTITESQISDLGSYATVAGPTFTGTVTVTNAGAGSNPTLSSNSAAQDLDLTGNLIISGDLTVSGTTVTVNTATYDVEDPLINLGHNNTSSHAVDLGWYGTYDPAGTDLFCGIVFDATDDKFRAFKDSQSEPTTTVNTGATGYTVATIVCNIEGNITSSGASNLSAGTLTVGVLAGTIDAGGATSFEIPNGAAPTVNADGEIALDTTVTDWSHGVVKYYGGEEMGVVAMPIAQFTSPTDNYVVTYNATNDEFELQAAGGGSIGGSTGSTDNALPKADGTGGSTLQATGIIVDDDDNISGHGTAIVTDATTSRTLAAADAGKLIRFTSSSAVTVTIPQTSTETIAAGVTWAVEQAGTGSVSIQREGSDTINGGSDPVVLGGQYAAVVVTKITAGSPNAYEIPVGDIPAQAVQADIEAETNEDTYVPPDLMKYHPGIAKAWVRHAGSSTITASYNVSSITDNGTGDFTINFSTAFSAATAYNAVSMGGANTMASQAVRQISTAAAPAAGSFRAFEHYVDSGGLSVAHDLNFGCLAFYGDQ